MSVLAHRPFEAAMAQPVAAALRGVQLRYRTGVQEVLALDDITLDIHAGKFVAVVGPSGCGKSTLMHLMCGITKPDRGEITLFGTPLRGLAKGIGYVFQSDGLLPWKTVSENIGLPLRIQQRPKAMIEEHVHDWLQRTGLTRFANAYPSQLSGGMRKRVALAQVLIAQPKLLLMDEPLSALDVQTRSIIGNELMGLWARTNSTVVLVTHDLEEAIGMADEVVVLSGRPARVKSVYPVDLPRPRDLHNIRLSDDFQEIYLRVWSDLREEVLLNHVNNE